MKLFIFLIIADYPQYRYFQSEVIEHKDKKALVKDIDEQLKTPSVKTLLFPVCIDFHWTILIIEKDVVYYYDPVFGAIKPQVRALRTALKREFIKIEQSESYPRQEDNNNCGVFVMLTTMAKVQNGRWHPSKEQCEDREYMKSCRRQIIKMLMQNHPCKHTLDLDGPYALEFDQITDSIEQMNNQPDEIPKKRRGRPPGRRVPEKKMVQIKEAPENPAKKTSNRRGRGRPSMKLPEMFVEPTTPVKTFQQTSDTSKEVSDAPKVSAIPEYRPSSSSSSSSSDDDSEGSVYLPPDEYQDDYFEEIDYEEVDLTLETQDLDVPEPTHFVEIVEKTDQADCEEVLEEETNDSEIPDKTPIYSSRKGRPRRRVPRISSNPEVKKKNGFRQTLEKYDNQVRPVMYRLKPEPPLRVNNIVQNKRTRVTRRIVFNPVQQFHKEHYEDTDLEKVEVMSLGDTVQEHLEHVKLFTFPSTDFHDEFLATAVEYEGSIKMFHFGRSLKKHSCKQKRMKFQTMWWKMDQKPFARTALSGKFPCPSYPVMTATKDEELFEQHVMTPRDWVSQLQRIIHRVQDRINRRRTTDDIIRDTSYFVREFFLMKAAISLRITSIFDVPECFVPPTMECGYFPFSAISVKDKVHYLQCRYREAQMEYLNLTYRRIEPKDGFIVSNITGDELYKFHKMGRHIHGFFLVWELEDILFQDHDGTIRKQRYLVEMFNFLMFPLYIPYERWDSRIKVGFDRLTVYTLHLTEIIRVNRPIFDCLAENPALFQNITLQEMCQLMAAEGYYPKHFIEQVGLLEFYDWCRATGNAEYLSAYMVITGGTKVLNENPMPPLKYPMIWDTTCAKKPIIVGCDRNLYTVLTEQPVKKFVIREEWGKEEVVHVTRARVHCDYPRKTTTRVVSDVPKSPPPETVQPVVVDRRLYETAFTRKRLIGVRRKIYELPPPPRKPRDPTPPKTKKKPGRKPIPWTQKLTERYRFLEPILASDFESEPEEDMLSDDDLPGVSLPKLKRSTSESSIFLDSNYQGFMLDQLSWFHQRKIQKPYVKRVDKRRKKMRKIVRKHVRRYRQMSAEQKTSREMMECYHGKLTRMAFEVARTKHAMRNERKYRCYNIPRVYERGEGELVDEVSQVLKNLVTSTVAMETANVRIKSVLEDKIMETLYEQELLMLKLPPTGRFELPHLEFLLLEMLLSRRIRDWNEFKCGKSSLKQDLERKVMNFVALPDAIQKNLMNRAKVEVICQDVEKVSSFEIKRYRSLNNYAGARQDLAKRNPKTRRGKGAKNAKKAAEEAEAARLVEAEEANRRFEREEKETCKRVRQRLLEGVNDPWIRSQQEEAQQDQICLQKEKKQEETRKEPLRKRGRPKKAVMQQEEERMNLPKRRRQEARKESLETQENISPPSPANNAASNFETVLEVPEFAPQQVSETPEAPTAPVLSANLIHFDEKSLETHEIASSAVLPAPEAPAPNAAEFAFQSTFDAQFDAQLKKNELDIEYMIDLDAPIRYEPEPAAASSSSAPVDLKKELIEESMEEITAPLAADCADVPIVPDTPGSISKPTLKHPEDFTAPISAQLEENPMESQTQEQVSAAAHFTPEAQKASFTAPMLSPVTAHQSAHLKRRRDASPSAPSSSSATVDLKKERIEESVEEFIALLPVDCSDVPPNIPIAPEASGPAPESPEAAPTVPETLPISASLCPAAAHIKKERIEESVEKINPRLSPACSDNAPISTIAPDTPRPVPETTVEPSKVPEASVSSTPVYSEETAAPTAHDASFSASSSSTAASHMEKEQEEEITEPPSSICFKDAANSLIHPEALGPAPKPADEAAEASTSVLENQQQGSADSEARVAPPTMSMTSDCLKDVPVVPEAPETSTPAPTSPPREPTAPEVNDAKPEAGKELLKSDGDKKLELLNELRPLEVPDEAVQSQLDLIDGAFQKLFEFEELHELAVNLTKAYRMAFDMNKELFQLIIKSFNGPKEEMDRVVSSLFNLEPLRRQLDELEVLEIRATLFSKLVKRLAKCFLEKIRTPWTETENHGFSQSVDLATVSGIQSPLYDQSKARKAFEALEKFREKLERSLGKDLDGPMLVEPCQIGTAYRWQNESTLIISAVQEQHTMASIQGNAWPCRENEMPVLSQNNSVWKYVVIVSLVDWSRSLIFYQQNQVPKNDRLPIGTVPKRDEGFYDINQAIPEWIKESWRASQ